MNCAITRLHNKVLTGAQWKKSVMGREKTENFQNLKTLEKCAEMPLPISGSF